MENTEFLRKYGVCGVNLLIFDYRLLIIPLSKQLAKPGFAEGGIRMKKVLQVMCCAAGSGMIGFFANQLNTAVGSICFSVGVVLLVASIIIICKQDH